MLVKRARTIIFVSTADLMRFAMPFFNTERASFNKKIFCDVCNNKYTLVMVNHI